MNITIGDIPYEIKLAENLHSGSDELLGEIDHYKANITLDENLPGAMLPVVLWHEVLHGVCNQTGLELSEEAITALAYQVCSLLNKNPLLHPQATVELLNGAVA